jgi:MFS family permease
MPSHLDASGDSASQDGQRSIAVPADRSPWHPLRLPVFRSLLIADLVSDTGMFMQSVGAAWLMLSLTPNPTMVALVQTVSTLPYFLIAIPAGALADIVDRRKLILCTELWMFAWSLVLAVLTIAGVMSPWLLLLLILLFSMGAALEGPGWQAIFPELVSKQDLTPALALNGIEFNLSRAVGPGLAGIVVAVAGAATAFVVNAFSFLGVIAVIYRWKRPLRKRLTPVETIGEGISAGFRYFRYSPDLRGIVLRAGVAMLFVSAFWALLPIVAGDLGAGSIGYGLLLSSFGAGAIAGALLLSRLRSQISTESILSAGIAIVALVIATLGYLHKLVFLCPVLFVGGIAWTPFMSVLNTVVQNLAPEWVRARVLAFYLLVFQGSIAAGSVLWGAVAGRFGLRITFSAAAIGLAASLVLRVHYAVPREIGDLSTWNHWPSLTAFAQPALDEGPVLVTVEYMIGPEKAEDFKNAMYHYQNVRRRDGAIRWNLYYDAKIPARYLETFIVRSWAEHLRQHDRFTVADRKVEDLVHSLVQQPPRVSHFIHATQPKGRR